MLIPNKVIGVEPLVRVLVPEIQTFFKREEGQRESAEWKAQQQTKAFILN